MVAGLLLPAAPAERPHVRDRAISRARPRPTPRHPRGLGRWNHDSRVTHPRRFVERDRIVGRVTGRGRGGRFSVGRKRETVLRLLRGEDLESVSRELGITAARASRWRDQFLAAGQAGLKSRAPDARDEDHRRLQAKIGELLMETELLYAKVDQLEAGSPLGASAINCCYPALISF